MKRLWPGETTTTTIITQNQLPLTYLQNDSRHREKPSPKIVCHRNDLISKQFIIKTLYDRCLVNKYSLLSGCLIDCICIIKRIRFVSSLSYKTWHVSYFYCTLLGFVYGL